MMRFKKILPQDNNIYLSGHNIIERSFKSYINVKLLLREREIQIDPMEIPAEGYQLSLKSW